MILTGANWNATSSAYATNRSSFGLPGTEFYIQHNFIITILLQKYHVKHTVNPKLQYNYSNNNYIPDPRGVDGLFCCLWWWIPVGMVEIFWQTTSLVHQLYIYIYIYIRSTVWGFDLRCESVTYIHVTLYTHTCYSNSK